jgi:predicted dehydrogenase
MGAGTHAGALSAESRFALVGGVDSHFQKARQFGERYGCHAFDKINEALVVLKPSLVSICTPDDTHYEITRTILSADDLPKVIFLEKPACKTKAEYDELISLAATRNVLVVVNHTRRFSAKYHLLKDLIASKEMGELYRANAIYYSGWMHNGTHVVDTLLYLLDDVIEWARLDGVVESPYAGDPTLELTGFWINSGAKIVVSAIDEAIYQLFDFDLWFKKGRLRIEDFGSRISLEKKVVNHLGEQVLESSTLDIFYDGLTDMQKAIGYIADYLDGKEADSLRFVTLEAVASTMKCLWQGKDLYLKTQESHEKI